MLKSFLQRFYTPFAFVVWVAVAFNFKSCAGDDRDGDRPRGEYECHSDLPNVAPRRIPTVQRQNAHGTERNKNLCHRVRLFHSLRVHLALVLVD